MKIEKTNFRRLRNNEHFQCQSDFKALVDEFTPVSLKIEKLYQEQYLPLYQAEDDAIFKIAKSAFTEARHEADERRDNCFKGMKTLINVNTNHFVAEKAEAAKRLKILFDSCGNLSQLPLQEETAAIYNLIQELDSKFKEDINLLKMNEWSEELEKNNKDYENLQKEGYEEINKRTEFKMKEVRLEIDKVLRQIVARLEALMVIEGEENYRDFIRRFNVRMEKYSNLISQREGRNLSKRTLREGERDEPKLSEEDVTLFDIDDDFVDM